ncbi:aminopeptidase C [Mycoplasma tauri]|uniref:aminopeptidase C n=1 Tax=Mycoplasma tauri TaxID=547987 RepID=UPI001CBEC943|nr:C1 family peptidase [Mycoplasma tauri]MBZ4204534.1 C1 family peptidase [Mycoplasma tauri]
MTITDKEIKIFYKKYLHDKNNKIVENSITKNGIKNSTLNNDVLRKHDNEFSIQVPKAGITDQKSSGRCWIFSATNMLKTNVLKVLNIENFEFSENFLFFWDKLEKSNTFLELIIQNPKLKYDDRLFVSFMDMTVSDGGYWEWAQGLIKKYGLVPKSAMNETNASTSTNELNQVLDLFLISVAKKIRDASSQGKNPDQLREIKMEALETVFAINAKALGVPPREFTFEYRDKDKNFHRINEITPLEFAKRFVGEKFLEKINLIHDPRGIHPVNRIYVSKYYKSVIEEKSVVALNTKIDEIKSAVIKSLKDGNPVWFDCDVTMFNDNKLGIFDTELFSFIETLKIEIPSKKDRLNFRLSTPNHAMTFVGVDLDNNGKPIKWEVENSWGDKHGNKGYFSMSDEWFTEYCFAVIVDPQYISEEVLEGLKQPVIELEPWDPLA